MDRSFDLQGEWNLANIIGGFEEIDQYFEKGTIIWNFNEVNSSVTVINSNTIADVYDGLPYGTYDYAIIESGDSIELVVNDINMGMFTFSTTNMTITPLFRDGYEIRFEK